MRNLKIGISALALAILTAATIAIANPTAQNGQRDPHRAHSEDLGRSGDGGPGSAARRCRRIAGPRLCRLLLPHPGPPHLQGLSGLPPEQGAFSLLRAVETLEPEIVRLDSSTLRTETDWIRAGEIVFDTPTDYDISGSPAQFRDPSYYTVLGIPVARDGTVPFVEYVIREKGKVEVGVLACGTCHTRVMPDGVVVKGAQGNFPFDRTAPEVPDEALPVIRRLLKMLYAVPWLEDRDPARGFAC